MTLASCVVRLGGYVRSLVRETDPWRLSFLFAIPIPAIALLIGLALEQPSNQVTAFDAVVYPILAAVLLVLHALLLFQRLSLQRVVMSVMLGACLFLFSKLVFLLYFAPPETNIVAEITESFFWIPAVYVLSSFVPHLRGGRAVAFTFFGAVLLVSLAYIMPSLSQARNYSVVYALSQINLANLTFLALTQAFVAFKERFARRDAHAQTMERLAHTDILTGLPNRLRLEQELREALVQATDDGTSLAVLYLDIDGFKLVNDTMGHERGDELLREMATRLASSRMTDLVARISGDEFVILVKDSGNEVEVMAIAELLKGMIERPAFLEGQIVAVTASVGVSFFPHDGGSGADLLRHADSAMYQVKTTGKNGVKRYQATVDAELEERKLIQRDLHYALRNGELRLHYQPIFDLTSGELKKAEALLCWHHPTRGLVSPEVFIRLAETSGLILPIGSWVLREACSQARAWHLKGLRGVAVSVNISPLQFLQAGFSESVFEALEASGLEPHYLELELTETIVMHNVEAAKRSLRELQTRGVAVAMDDFGTGYSSLSYLKDLMIDTLKIDKSFVRDLSSPRRTPQYALAVISAIVTVAKTLDIAIVAEGIEHEEQFTLLRDLGVDLGQGFFFSASLPADALEFMLASRVIKETVEPAMLRLN